MNTATQKAGLSTLVAAMGLGALPPGVYERVIPAIQGGASLEVMHEAARAVADECPTTCLQGVVFSLIFLLNANQTATGEGAING